MNFHTDVEFCASAIHADLARNLPPNVAFSDLIDLCARHGGLPLPAPGLSPRRVACFIGDDILITPCGSLEQYQEALPHELTHRLADTERWAALNSLVCGWRYDRALFIEAVARSVGRMFANPDERYLNA